MSVTILEGDCRDVLAGMPECSVHAIVTDPPYGLGFMGKDWDSSVPFVWIIEALRVLKPGGHLLAFGGTRTYHRLACSIEDAGFELRDSIIWLYSQGFPKSLDVSKAIDKAAGAERERIRGVRSGIVRDTYAQDSWSKEYKDSVLSSEPITDAAKDWEGWGTALKPGHEPIVVARKPLLGSVAANILKHGTGALNIDGCRIDPGSAVPGGGGGELSARSNGLLGRAVPGNLSLPHDAGRWPANVILDEGAAEELDAKSGELVSGSRSGGVRSGMGYHGGRGDGGPSILGNSGGASRFFYTAKASRSERGRDNDHPTVKPLSLMRWLVRLVTPPGGTVADPFAGSGTTLVAAIAEGLDAIGIEQSSDYCRLIEKRIGRAQMGFIFEEATA